MKQFNRISLWLTFGVLISLIASLFFFFHQSKADRRINLVDHVLRDFREGLAYEMADLLSFSLALSEDGELKNALIAEDEDKGHVILSKITERFKKYTHLKSLRIQVLSSDFFIFARSWNKGFEGMPIWWFREDLKNLTRNTQPKVGMEIGRLLTFKATIPIRSVGKLLGYLEVIKFVDEMVEKLHKREIALFALMDEQYLNQAALMRDFPQVHGHVIVNQNFNDDFLHRVEALDWKKLESESYLAQDGRLYIAEPMRNGEGKKIGIYLLILSDEAQAQYAQNPSQNTLFNHFSNRDIEGVVTSWEHPHGSFREQEDRELIEILPKLTREDKQELERKAKKILQGYSKNELIDIILSNEHNEKKRGEIE